MAINDDSPVDALEQAIALYRAPARLSRLQGRPLGNTLLLLRIAANDRAAIASAAQVTGETEATVTDAALLYIQQVLFADTADAYRLLGARPRDTAEQIKEHHRWLMRWLHPDRQPERWEVVYSDRVNQAWQILRSPERRAAYDLSLHSNTLVDVHEPRLRMRHRAAIETSRPLLSSQTKRRLPQLILGGLGLGAVIALGLLYVSQEGTHVSGQVASDASVPAPSTQIATHQPATRAAISPGTTVPIVVNATPVTAMQKQSSMVAISTRNEEPRPQSAPATPIAALASRPVPPPQTYAPRPLAIQSQRVVAAIVAPASNAQRHDPVAAASTNASGAGVREANKDAPVATVANKPADTTAGTVPDAVVSRSPERPTLPVSRSPKEAASALVGSFTHAYAAGDLAAMMGLFSADAVNNRGGVDAIATDYDKLFRDTQSRELRLERLAWTTSGDRIIGSGPFEANIQRRGESTEQRVNGWITIEAKLIDGHWRIQRLIHRDTR